MFTLFQSSGWPYAKKKGMVIKNFRRVMTSFGEVFENKDIWQYYHIEKYSRVQFQVKFFDSLSWLKSYWKKKYS